MALSQDLRLRIVDLVVSGVSRRKAAVHFQVSASSAIRFVKQAEEVGHVDVKVRKKRKSRLDPFHGDLVDWIGEQPDLTLAELCSRVFDADGLRVGSSTLDDWLRANQITYKKTAHASEQERSDVRAKRYRWRKRQDWLKQHLHLLGRIVFIDETGLNTKMARPRGRSAKGQRLVASIPHGHWKTMTFIAGLRYDGMTAPWVLDGPMDGPASVAMDFRSTPASAKRVIIVLRPE